MTTEAWLLIAVVYAMIITLLWFTATGEAKRLDRQVEEAAALVIEHQDAYAKMADAYAEQSVELASAVRQLQPHRG